MGSVGMTILAADPAFTDRTAGAGPCNFMPLGPMTFLAGKILSSHMNIMRPVRTDQCCIQITVLNAVASAAAKMAGPTGGTGRGTDTPGDFHKIKPRSLLTAAGGRFFVGAGGVMANKAIHP